MTNVNQHISKYSMLVISLKWKLYGIVSAFIHLPSMILSMDLHFEQWLERIESPLCQIYILN